MTVRSQKTSSRDWEARWNPSGAMLGWIAFSLLTIGTIMGVDHAFHSTHLLGMTASVLIGAGMGLIGLLWGGSR